MAQKTDIRAHGAVNNITRFWISTYKAGRSAANYNVIRSVYEEAVRTAQANCYQLVTIAGSDEKRA
ncbi:MAG: hypothetical protein ABIG61_11595 [Planctomycetota bacterium]